MYQINAHRIRVLSHSDGEPFPLITPKRLDNEKHDKPVTEREAGSANAAFTNFSLHKRPKILPKTGQSSATTATPTQTLNVSIPADASSSTVTISSKQSTKKTSKMKKRDIEERMDED